MQKRVITLLVIANLITFSFFGYIFVNSAKFDTPSYSQLEINRARDYFATNFITQPTKAEQIQIISSMYDIKYTLYYADLKAYGKALPLVNVIILSNDIPINIFSKVLAHELEHLSFEFREYIVEYRAIIRLWESDIPYLKYQAYLGAKTVLDGRLGKRYDCTNLLVKYSKENANEN